MATFMAMRRSREAGLIRAPAAGRLIAVPPSDANADNLVWIDLEMTGLDPASDVILQAALVITTADLVPLDEVAFDIWQPEEALRRMIPIVREMHERTGLTGRVRRSAVRVPEVERALVERVLRWCVPPATLCGNSVWSDRRFIERYLPDLHRALHYRIVDVSSLKVLAQRWYGEAAAFQKPAAGEHDARVDIHNSIAELQHYRRILFRERPGA
jgi:oligoribonuclease